MKEYDYFVTSLTNPNYSVMDLKDAGLTTDNTQLKKIDEYRKLDVVQQAFTDENGVFKEDLFKEAYKNARMAYNELDAYTTLQSISNLKIFSKWNYFVDNGDPQKEKEGEATWDISLQANPHLQSTGIALFGVTEAPTLSDREIAETRPVYDPDTKTWSAAPNDNFWDNVFNVRVLASNDDSIKDADGNIVVPRGAEIKYDELGLPYYENLDGRSIYGKLVLSITDVLTRDGSRWNKYDFFDSDDLEKSIGGSLAQAVIKVLPAFIPYIGPAYVGARVALEFTDLAAKVGKMLLGENVKFLNNMEGFVASTDFSTSDAAQQNAWSAENLIKMGSDVFTLLAEQRWIFTTIPAIATGKPIGFLEKGHVLGWSEKGMNKFLKDTLEAIKTKNLAELTRDGAKGLKAWASLNEVSNIEAGAILTAKQKSMLKVGEYISKLYMTGITTADSYGEALLEGLSREQAALFTLGYSLGEWGILNTQLGEMILPELRLERQSLKKAIREVATMKQPKQIASANIKRNWALKIIKAGKEYWDGQYSVGKLTAKHLIANALGEGVEEVSEELLADMSKTLNNIAVDILGTGKQLTAWDNVFDRYTLSFVGGAIGGGIGQVYESVQSARKIASSKSSVQELIYAINEGKADELVKMADKMELASKNLSAKKLTDGTFDEGTDKDNLDKAVKKVFADYVYKVRDMLQAQGAIMSSNSLLKHLSTDVIKDLRMNVLSNTSIATSYVEDWNELQLQILENEIAINAIENPSANPGTTETTDLEERHERQEAQNRSEADELRLNDLKKKRTELAKRRDSFIAPGGEMSKLFVRDAMFEINTGISQAALAPTFEAYVESKEHTDFANIGEARLKELKEEWEAYQSLDAKSKIRFASEVFWARNEKFSNAIKNHNAEYFENTEGNVVSNLNDIFLAGPTEFSADQGSYRLALLGDNVTSLVEALVDAPSVGMDPQWSRNYLVAIALVSHLVGLYGISAEEDYSNDSDRRKLSLRNLAADLHYAAYNYNELPDAIKERLKTEKGIENEHDYNTKIRLETVENALKFVLSYYNTDVTNAIKGANYINISTKALLSDIVQRYSLWDASQEEGDNPQNDIYKANLDRLMDALNEAKTSPIAQFLDTFLLTIGDTTHTPVSKLLEYCHSLLNASKSDVGSFGMDEDTTKAIDNAIDLINLLRSHVLAARRTGGDIDNLFGYNVLLNQVNNTDLAVIEDDTAAAILKDLSRVETELVLYSGLFEANSENKLKDQPRINTKLFSLLYKKAKTFISVLPDGDDKRELELVLNSVKVVHSIEDNFSLSDEDLAELFLDRLKVEGALHKYMNKHLDDLDSILKGDNFNWLEPNEGVLNLSTDHISDRQFLDYLKVVTALRTDSFYKEYREIISGDVVPIPGLEFAIRALYAFLLNPEVFEKFGKAYNKSLAEQISGLSQEKVNELAEQGISVSKEYPNASSLTQQFNTLFFVDGIPGSGKSTIYKVLLTLIGKYHPSLLEKVIVVHNSEANAKNLVSKINVDLSKWKFFSHDEYLKYLNSNYHKEFNSDGTVKLDLDNYEYNENGSLVHKGLEPDLSIERPSLVIIDESTNLSEADHLFLEKAHKALGIVGLSSGDTDLLGATGSLVKETKTLDPTTNTETTVTETDYAKISRHNFNTTFKLGSSIRSANKYKETNNSLIRLVALQLKEALITDDPTKVAVSSLVYHLETLDETKKGLYGDMTIASDSTYLKSTIETMLDSLGKDSDGNDEKLVFAYNSTTSALYTLMLDLNTTGKYKDKITFLQQGVSQGTEGKYYVADIAPISVTDRDATGYISRDAADRMVKSFYTILSRSSLGSLLVLPPEPSICEKANITSIATSEMPTTLGLKESARKKYAENRKEIIKVPDDTPGTKLEARVKGLEAPKEKKSPEEILVDPGESDDTASDTADEDTTTEANKNNEAPSLENKEEGKLNSYLYSFLTDDIGAIENSDGTLTLDNGGATSVERIDGVNGLVKFFAQALGISVQNGKVSKEDAKKLKKVLYGIRSHILYDRDVNSDNLIDYVRSTLQIKKLSGAANEPVIRIDYGFKMSDWVSGNDDGKAKEDFIRNNTNPRTLQLKRFFRNVKERVMNIFGIDPKSKENSTIRRTKQLVALINVDGKNLLEIPIYEFMNPETMLNSLDFKELKAKFEEGKSSNVNYSAKDFLNDLKLDSKNYPHKVEMMLLLELYTWNDPGKNYKFVYIDNFKELILSFEETGVTIWTKESGANYEHNSNYYAAAEWKTLSDMQIPGRKISKIYTAKESEKINGKTVIKAGHPFVLVSDYYSTFTDKQLLDAYRQEQQSGKSHKISLIYVTTPGVTVKEYLNNLKKVFATNEKADPDIGNMATSFRILQVLFNETGEGLIKKLDLSIATHGGKILESWENSKKYIKAVLDAVSKIQTNDSESWGTAFVNFLGDDISKHTELLKLYKESGIGKSKTVKDSLLKFLWSITKSSLKAGLIGVATNPTDEAIDLIDKAVSDAGWKGGIFYRLPLEGSQSPKHLDSNILANTLTYVDADDKVLLKFKNGDIKIDGRLLPTALRGDISPLLTTILERLNDVETSNKDLNRYAFDNPPETPVTLTFDDHLKSVYPDLDVDSVPSEIKELFNNLSEKKKKSYTPANFVGDCFKKGYALVPLLPSLLLKPVKVGGNGPITNVVRGMYIKREGGKDVFYAKKKNNTFIVVDSDTLSILNTDDVETLFGEDVELFWKHMNDADSSLLYAEPTANYTALLKINIDLYFANKAQGPALGGTAIEFTNDERRVIVNVLGDVNFVDDLVKIVNDVQNGQSDLDSGKIALGFILDGIGISDNPLYMTKDFNDRYESFKKSNPSEAATLNNGFKKILQLIDLILMQC